MLRMTSGLLSSAWVTGLAIISLVMSACCCADSPPSPICEKTWPMGLFIAATAAAVSRVGTPLLAGALGLRGQSAGRAKVKVGAGRQGAGARPAGGQLGPGALTPPPALACSSRNEARDQCLCLHPRSSRSRRSHVMPLPSLANDPLLQSLQRQRLLLTVAADSLGVL